MINSRKSIKIGNINTIRDFTYVEDLCKAYWKLYKSKNGYGEIMNVCSSNPLKVKKLYEKIKLLTNYKGKMIIEKKRIRPKNSEVNKLIGSNKKIKRNLKWTSSNFDINLKITVDWFKNNLSLFKNDGYEI